MCKSMNALFLSLQGQRTRKQLLDKLSRSSNKKEVLMMRIRLKAIIQWSGITLI